MEDSVFENWFQNCFASEVEGKERPVTVLFDEHGSHLTCKTLETAIKEQIEIYLPPSTGHALQPLDVAVFGPLKINWGNVVNRYFRET